jgi:guanylate cyclase soluble subunit beta
MYGLINNSLKNMILEQFGEDQWQKVVSTSGVSEDSFLTMRSYHE